MSVGPFAAASYRSSEEISQCGLENPLRVSVSSLKNLKFVHEQQKNSSTKCVRCGTEMKESNSIFVTIHPHKSNSKYHNRSSRIKGDIGGAICPRNIDETRCTKGGQLDVSELCCDNHVKVSVSVSSKRNSSKEKHPRYIGESSSESPTKCDIIFNEISNVKEQAELPLSVRRTHSKCRGCKNLASNKTSRSENRCAKCGILDSFHVSKQSSRSSCDDVDALSDTTSEININDVESDLFDSNDDTETEDEVLNPEKLGDKSCTDCHVALVRDVDKVLSLMLQVPEKSHPVKMSTESQTDTRAVSKVDVGIGVNILGMYPATVKNSGPSADVTKVSSGEYSDILPDLNRQAEAAYESHKQNLVPCDHCGRRFTADRVMVHQDACIENPGKMTRKTVTPDRDALK